MQAVGSRSRVAAINTPLCDLLLFIRCWHRAVPMSRSRRLNNPRKFYARIRLRSGHASASSNWPRQRRLVRFARQRPTAAQLAVGAYAFYLTMRIGNPLLFTGRSKARLNLAVAMKPLVGTVLTPIIMICAGEVASQRATSSAPMPYKGAARRGRERGL